MSYQNIALQISVLRGDEVSSVVIVIATGIDYLRRRIGLAPNVSIPGASLSSNVVPTLQPLIGQQILRTQPRPDTANSNSQVDVVISRPSVGQYHTAPERANGNANGNKPDEFGVTRTAGDQESNISSERSERPLAQTIGGTPALGASIGSGTVHVAPQANEATAIARPRASSAVAGAGVRRLTVTNYNEAEAAEHQAQERATNATRASSASAVNPAASRPAVVPKQGPMRPRVFPSAEEEKRLLYEAAVAKVEQTQGVLVPRPLSPVGVSCPLSHYVLDNLTCHFSLCRPRQHPQHLPLMQPSHLFPPLLLPRLQQPGPRIGGSRLRKRRPGYSKLLRLVLP